MDQGVTALGAYVPALPRAPEPCETNGGRLPARVGARPRRGPSPWREPPLSPEAGLRGGQVEACTSALEAAAPLPAPETSAREIASAASR